MNLTVRPLKQKDAGRGLAALDPRAAEELGVESGDYIVIDGEENRAVARVWPGYPEDPGRGVIRIDGRLRQEAGVGIDDRVEVVETADVKPAESITVALPQNLRIQGNVGPLIRDRLSGRPITQGQDIRVGFSMLGAGSGQSIPMRIDDTTPSGTVVATENTEINVSERPAEEVSAGGAPRNQGTEQIRRVEDQLEDDTVEGTIKNTSRERLSPTVIVTFYEDPDCEFHLAQKSTTPDGFLKPDKKWSFSVTTEKSPQSYEIDIETS